MSVELSDFLTNKFRKTGDRAPDARLGERGDALQPPVGEPCRFRGRAGGTGGADSVGVVLGADRRGFGAGVGTGADEDGTGGGRDSGRASGLLMASKVNQLASSGCCGCGFFCRAPLLHNRIHGSWGGRIWKTRI